MWYLTFVIGIFEKHNEKWRSPLIHVAWSINAQAILESPRANQNPLTGWKFLNLFALLMTLCFFGKTQFRIHEDYNRICNSQRHPGQIWTWIESDSEFLRFHLTHFSIWRFWVFYTKVRNAMSHSSVLTTVSVWHPFQIIFHFSLWLHSELNNHLAVTFGMAKKRVGISTIFLQQSMKILSLVFFVLRDAFFQLNASWVLIVEWNILTKKILLCHAVTRLLHCWFSWVFLSQNSASFDFKEQFLFLLFCLHTAATVNNNFVESWIKFNSHKKKTSTLHSPICSVTSLYCRSGLLRSDRESLSLSLHEWRQMSECIKWRAEDEISFWLMRFNFTEPPTTRPSTVRLLSSRLFD